MEPWPFGALTPLSCDVIVADPPWDFENYSPAGTTKGADPHYDVMPLGGRVLFWKPVNLFDRFSSGDRYMKPRGCFLCR
jgi:hypothetical protein